MLWADCETFLLLGFTAASLPDVCSCLLSPCQRSQWLSHCRFTCRHMGHLSNRKDMSLDRASLARGEGVGYKSGTPAWEVEGLAIRAWVVRGCVLVLVSSQIYTPT